MLQIINETKKEFITSDSEHWYQSKSKPEVYYPSVTTILSIFPKGIGFNKYLTAQTDWESSQASLKEAGRRGTNVHHGTELLEDGHTLVRESYALDEWQMLEAFVDWYHAFKPELHKKEYSVVSDKLKTGGTIDRIYQIDGKTVLLDIKTSNAIHDNYWCQVAAYVYLLEKEGDVIDEVSILRLAPRTKLGYQYETRSRDEFKEDFKIFKAMQQTWNYLNPKAKPKILEVPSLLKL